MKKSSVIQAASSAKNSSVTSSNSVSGFTTSSTTTTITGTGTGTTLSGYYPASGYSSSGYSSTLGTLDSGVWEYLAPKVDISDESIKKIVEKIFDSEDDLFPLVKNYLVKYLDKVMDEPEEIVKELVKEKDEEINHLKEEVDNLNKKLAELEEKIERISRSSAYLGEGEIIGGPTVTRWFYDHDGNANTASGGIDSWTTTTISCSDATDASANAIYDYYTTATDSSTILSAANENKASQNLAVKASYDSLASKIEKKMSDLNTTYRRG